MDAREVAGPRSTVSPNHERVLVTGASGTVGSVVATTLAKRGFHVRAMVRHTAMQVQGDSGPSDHCASGSLGGRIERVVADLSDSSSLAESAHGVTFAVHCAATLTADPTLCWRTNVEGTANLVRALLEAGCRRLVNLSSMSVYDLSAGWNLDEDSPVWADWRSPYGRSKVEAERIVHAASAQGLMSVTLRPVPVLSLHPRSFWGPLALARALAMNSPVFGCTELPFVHVDNLADAVVRALHSDKAIGRHYDVIDAYGPTTRYLDALAVATGRPAPHLSDEAPTIRIAGQRIRAELGYDPEDRFEDFITQLKDAATNGRIARLPRK